MDMVLNDSTDHSTFSNTSGNPEDSAERCDMEDPMMEVSNGPDEKFENKPPSMANPDASVASAMLIPSMRGTMTYAGGSITCKGKWAMSDANHSVTGNTSDFEFKLVKKDENCMKIFPVDGMYQGWFMLKQAPPAKGSIKVEDKEMELHFQPDEDNNHKITGHGSNKFGHFNLYGTLSDQGAVHIYREYFQLNPLSVATPVAKKPVGRPEGTQRRPSIGVDPSETPRESSGRIRKQSSVLKDYQDLQVKHATPRATPRESFDGGVEAASSSSLQRQASVERSHRLAPAMRKCADLLREMSKFPQARWFLEPVDPIKLQIPDYPKIIKTPMDFSTVRANIEGGLYETIDAFAEDMRLVFRNAITFNAARDNIVNINAREVSSKFEDRFRMIVAQMESASYALLPPETKLSRTASSSSFATASKGVNGNKKRPSMGSTPRSSVPGPRQPFPFVPPAAVDGNLTQMLALQRQMEDMKAELDRLRHAVQEKDVAKSLRETKDAAQNPLTMEEKRQLVQMVSKLTSDKMDRLVEIIRDGLPDDKKDDEITEVPLDILDTLTLRRLQNFVKDNVSSVKKRAAPGSTIPRARAEPSAKKAKKSVGGAEFGGAAGGATEHDIDLFDHAELLTERFEDNAIESSGLDVHEDLVLQQGSGATIVAAPTDAVSLSGYDSAQGGDRDEDQSDWAVLGSG